LHLQSVEVSLVSLVIFTGVHLLSCHEHRNSRRWIPWAFDF